MKPSRVVCLLLSMVLGEVGVTAADYGVQPIMDAVLFIDGAPTYLRLTNSTSLETVYNCVLDNSQNVNSVILSTQIKGVQMDVGQVEESVNEVIRLLSAEAASNGRTLWKSPEELKLFKSRLARYLTSNYYGSRGILEPDTYLNYKSQRSAEWLYNNKGTHFNYHRVYPTLRQQRDPRRHFGQSSRSHGQAPQKSKAGLVRHEIGTTAVTERVETVTHATTPTSASPSPSTRTSQSVVTSPSVPESSAGTVDAGSHQLTTKRGVEQKSFPRIDPVVTTAVIKDQEGTTISSEGVSKMEKSKRTVMEKDVGQAEEKDKSAEEEVQSRDVRRRGFKTGRTDNRRNVTDNSDGRVTTDEGRSQHVRPSEETATESDKPKKKSRGRRRNSKKRSSKTRQQSSTVTADPNGGD